MPKYTKHHLVQCGSCGFVFCRPIPSVEELNKHYHGYGSGQHDYISPITVSRYKELLASFSPYATSKRVLDVGCGSGHFLVIALQQGWEVHGTEYSDTLFEVCQKKGIAMKLGPLDVSHYEPESFDVITSFEVLEHINNPLEELDKFYSLLKPGGLVYCTTPNFNALQRFQLCEDYSIITYPEHLSYYTRDTLWRVFKKAGFKKKKILTTGVSLSRAKPRIEKTQFQITGETAPDELARQRIESNQLLQVAKTVANKALSISGTGLTLKGYFEKPVS